MNVKIIKCFNLFISLLSYLIIYLLIRLFDYLFIFKVFKL